MKAILIALLVFSNFAHILYGSYLAYKNGKVRGDLLKCRMLLNSQSVVIDEMAVTLYAVDDAIKTYDQAAELERRYGQAH